jgi:hypothetical protein
MDVEYDDTPEDLGDLVRELANVARDVPEPPDVAGRSDLLKRLGMPSCAALAATLGLQPSQVERYIDGRSNGDGPITGNVLQKVDAATRV